MPTILMLSATMSLIALTATPAGQQLRSPTGSNAQPPKGGSYAAPAVRIARVPGGGIQPQVAVDDRGVIHLIYFKGNPPAGDLFYCTSGDGAETFSAPIRVNSRPGSAVAIGSIRGAHLALGRRGRVHVAWMGSSQAEPKGPGGAAPMLYARLNDAGTAFEPQRNVITSHTGLDGGGSVAADGQGHVYVAWHAPEGQSHDEAARRIWVARSDDDGATFGAETAASTEPTGVCACCGMRAFARREGGLFILYRTAEQGVHRDMYLLRPAGKAGGFEGLRLDPWESKTCVMSSAAFTETAGGLLGVWETKGQVLFARIDAGPGQASAGPGDRTMRDGGVGSKPETMPGPAAAIGPSGPAGQRKHPALAVNRRGEVLLTWTDGAAWNRGGQVGWQIFDGQGRPIAGAGGRARDLPAWGLVAALATADGDFVILY